MHYENIKSLNERHDYKKITHTLQIVNLWQDGRTSYGIFLLKLKKQQDYLAIWMILSEETRIWELKKTHKNI